MPRPAKGTIEVEPQGDGTLAFRLRFRVDGRREQVYLHERRDCDCGCRGNWTERNARRELENIMALVKAGRWERPAVRERREREKHRTIPTFHVFSSGWLDGKAQGIIGRRRIKPRTKRDYEWRLAHVLPYLAKLPVDAIDQPLCLDVREQIIRRANEQREAIDAGVILRDRTGKRIRPLSPASIRKVLEVLAAVLDWVVEEKYLPENPARCRRMEIDVDKPVRTFLEPDELMAVEQAAGEQDAPLTLYAQAAAQARGSTRGAVALRASEAMNAAAIAKDLGIAKSTVSFHLNSLGLTAPKYVGRRAIVCTLGRSGIRIGELCKMRIGHLRLHTRNGAQLRIPDAKTRKGIREVIVSPELAEQLRLHIDLLRRSGRNVEPDAYVFQSERGGRLGEKRVSAILREAANAASEAMIALGLPPLQHTTPHSMRRTYISIALLASRCDLLWVMNQVGHKDSAMTLEVYAQLQQRIKRDNGAAFDKLVADAREQLYGPTVEPFSPANSPVERDQPETEPVQAPVSESPAKPQNPHEQRAWLALALMLAQRHSNESPADYESAALTN